MSSDFQSVMIQVIAQLCGQVGFESITEGSLELLVSVFEQYFLALAKAVHSLTSADDSCAQISDGLVAMRLLGESPHNLVKFLSETGAYFSGPPSIACGPVCGKVCLNVPREDDPELESRPPYILRHLPTNYCDKDETTANAQLDMDPEVDDTSSVAPPCTESAASKCLSVSTASSCTFANRALPAWAGQTSYRMTCLSVDPLTKTLIEHCPPCKTTDVMYPDSPLSAHMTGSGASSLSNYFAHTQSKRDPIHSPKSQNSYDEPVNSSQLSNIPRGTSDAQWAAALQATPIAQPCKRIVYTPTRFDPSSTHGSLTYRKSTNNTRPSSSLNRPHFGLDSVNKRQATPYLHASTNKTGRLSNIVRGRRHCKVGRKRTGRFAHRRISSTSRNSTNDSALSKLPVASTLFSNPPTPILNNLNDSHSVITSEGSPSGLKKCTQSNELDSLKYSLDSISEVASRQKQADNNSFLHVIDSDSDVGMSPTTNSPSNQTENRTCLSCTSTEQIDPSPILTSNRPLDRSQTPDTVRPQSIQPKLSETRHFQPRSRGRRPRNRTSRVATTISMMHSLFQNPLRLNNPFPVSSGSPTSVANSSQEAQVEFSKTVTPNKQVVGVRSRGRPCGRPRKRPFARRPSRESNRSILNAAVEKIESESVVKAEKSSSPVLVSKNRSPASDTTEPMMDEVKANLLVISSELKSFPAQKTTDFSDSLIHNTVNQNVIATSNTDSTLFNKESFGRLQFNATTHAISLPTSPSSLDSSLSSSSSSSTSPHVTYPHLKSEVCENMKPAPNVMEITQSPDKLSVSALPADARAPIIEGPNRSLISTTSPSHITSAVQPPPPPPLIYLSTKNFDSRQSPKTIEDRVPTHPPVLVPSCTVECEQSKTKPSIITTTTSTNSMSRNTQPPTAKNGGLRITIRLGTNTNDETLASSLSPSSSSSLSSSSSTIGSPERLAAPNRSVEIKCSDETNKYSATTAPINQSHSMKSEQSPLNKAPKLVIRFGNNSVTTTTSTASTTLAQTQSNANSFNYVKPVSEVIEPPPSLPPPLQLTISRDRLKYRGRTVSDCSDSNASSSSSSGTESLTSGSEEQDGKILPPPPSLERLPPVTHHVSPTVTATVSSTPKPEALITHPPVLVNSIVRTSPGFLSEAPKKPPTGAHTVSSSTINTTNCLPPLLPLFSNIKTTTLITSTTDTPIWESAQSAKLNSGIKQDSAQTEIPSNFQYDHHSRCTSKPKLVSSSSNRVLCDTGNAVTTKTLHTRVRVDSVFTDDDEDDDTDDEDDEDNDDGDIEMKTNTSKNNTTVPPVYSSADIGATHLSNQQPIATSNPILLDEPLVFHDSRSQSCTKNISISTYRSHSSHRMVKNNTKLPTSHSSKSVHSGSKTASNPQAAKHQIASCNQSTKVAHRDQPASQIVEYSAGSSYYFNNNGDQIWLCPICLLEDDGNLMIGCDKCDDWYHSTCLGLSREPEVPQWFCPKCSGNPFPSASVNSVLNRSTDPPWCNSTALTVRKREQHQRVSVAKGMKRKPKR